ncbi:MAG TPA: methylated-DNA--[protein]-cysteine S-methyltransferase [Terriglobia bacterium]|nr:methylated-DNA--[protein]-cysteine S-methyltransferase [Terriglobia bacterium]
MPVTAYCLFETTLGWCAIAWRESSDASDPFAVTAFQLPEATAKMTKARIEQKTGATLTHIPPPQINKIMQRICLHLQGGMQDFRDVPVDLEGTGWFLRKVCEAARTIPAGKTVTYAALAEAIGKPAQVRAVGRALGRNPIPLIIPCHRVVAAHGRPGGFSAHGGRVTKARLLALEGATVNLCLDFT